MYIQSGVKSTNVKIKDEGDYSLRMSVAMKEICSKLIFAGVLTL